MLRKFLHLETLYFFIFNGSYISILLFIITALEYFTSSTLSFLEELNEKITFPKCNRNNITLI